MFIRPCYRKKNGKTARLLGAGGVLPNRGQKRLHTFHLPSYSPDWNPDEKVWNHLKHHELKGHQAKTKDELKKLTRRKLKTM